jgi:IclR family KDG regulon transcriptional repressor
MTALPPADSARASAKSSASPAESGTVNRVLRLLAAFGQKDRWSFSDLGRALNLPTGTMHRLLGLCKPLSFVDQDDNGLYTPGVELYRLAARLAAEIPINRLAQPVLDHLRDRTDETAILTLLVRNDLKMFFSLTAAPADPMRYTIECNKLQPLGWGATGRVLLAYLSEEEVEEVVRRGEPSPLDNRPLDAAELRASLEAIRREGRAVTHSQRTPNACGLAVPFFDRGGQVRGNLTFTIPEFRYREENREMLLGLLEEGAKDLSRRLGWA